MSDLSDLTKKIIQYRDDRDWKQFHNPKDLALSLMLEAGELAEHFQWQTEEEMNEYVAKHREEIGEELADALHVILIMCHDMNIDLIEVSKKKMQKNAAKYPVEKSKGNHTKYDKL